MIDSIEKWYIEIFNFCTIFGVKSWIAGVWHYIEFGECASGSLFNQHLKCVPMQLRPMGLSESPGKVQEHNPINSSKQLILEAESEANLKWVLQNKHIATLKDNIKDLQLVEKIYYFKNGLAAYPNKISKIILLYISFKMKKLVSFSLTIVCSMWCVNKIYKIPHLGNEGGITLHIN